jgi:hypothetical protein
MAIIGQGVQAGLGRVDYTPYLQGAMAGSQGIAQGIASIGQSAAQGIQSYFQKKEEKRQEEEASQMISGILKTNPGLSSQLNQPQMSRATLTREPLKLPSRVLVVLLMPLGWP